MFSPPHSIEQAYLIRQALMWAWRLFPFIYAAAAVAIFMRGSRACKRRIAGFGIALAAMGAILVMLFTVVAGFAPHGESSLSKSLRLLAQELVAPGQLSPWPGYQFPMAIGCYAILIFIVATCVRSRRNGKVRSGS